MFFISRCIDILSAGLIFYDSLKADGINVATSYTSSLPHLDASVTDTRLVDRLPSLCFVCDPWNCVLLKSCHCFHILKSSKRSHELSERFVILPFGPGSLGVQFLVESQRVGVGNCRGASCTPQCDVTFPLQCALHTY